MNSKERLKLYSKRIKKAGFGTKFDSDDINSNYLGATYNPYKKIINEATNTPEDVTFDALDVNPNYIYSEALKAAASPAEKSNWVEGALLKTNSETNSETKAEEKSAETSHGTRGEAFSGDQKAFKDYIVKELESRGVTPRHAKVLAALFALETTYGKKMTGNYNYGNIVSQYLKDGKYHGTGWDGEEVKLPTNSRYFRSYETFDQALADTAKLMKNRYDIDIYADNNSLKDSDFVNDFTSKLNGNNSSKYKWAEDTYGDRIKSTYKYLFG